MYCPGTPTSVLTHDSTPAPCFLPTAYSYLLSAEEGPHPVTWVIARPPTPLLLNSYLLGRICLSLGL